MKASKFDGQKFLTPPQTNTSTLVGFPGGQLAISSDGETAGTGVVWAVRSKRTTPGLSAAAAAVQAWVDAGAQNN